MLAASLCTVETCNCMRHVHHKHDIVCLCGLTDRLHVVSGAAQLNTRSLHKIHSYIIHNCRSRTAK